MKLASLRSHNVFFTSGSLLLALLGPACVQIGDAPDRVGESELALDEAVTSSAVVTTVTTGPGGVGGASGVGGSGGAGTGGAGAGGSGTGGSGPGPNPPSEPPALGLWRFDDCDPATTALADSSGNGLTATRTASVACAEGVQGFAASFDASQDLVEVPHQPAISFGNDIAVAAWVSPTELTGNNPIIYQRLNGKTSFLLGIEDGEAVFRVTLTTGKTVTTRAPVSGGEWMHLAGLYNGQFVFLFINGQQVGQIAASGSVRNVDGPIRIGKIGANARFDGLIDEVWLSNSPVSAADVQGLSCLRRPTTLSVSPATSGPVPPETPVSYEITVQNNDIGACAPGFFLLSPGSNPDISFSVLDGFREIFPGEAATMTAEVTASFEAEPGVHEVGFSVIEFNEFEEVQGSLTYEVIEPTGCFVRTGRELLIRHTSVVEDPIRTTFDAPGDPRAGVWTFGKLMEDMAPTPADAPAMVEQMFSTWLTPQTVNGFVVEPRPFLQQLVLSPWPRTASGALDLTQAPLRLLAIVNRIDLRDLAAGRAGEGRFVFGVVDPNGFPTEFTLILEYSLPASTEQDVMSWANAWHALGSLPFPSEEYNAALQAITTQFAGRGAAPSRPNGSALSQLRTNEIALSAPWELREFTISPVTGFLAPAPVALNPDLAFNGTPTLADFVNANEATILTERHVVPELLGGAPFLGGSSINDGFSAWDAPGILNGEARHKFSLNTCSGCHGFAETGTAFLHVFPRSAGVQSSLSGFMTGITLPDPITGEPRAFNDLGRRAADLRGLVCPPDPSAMVAGPSIARGIGRVH